MADGGVRVRAMEARDVDRVVAIAEELPTAPHWPTSSYTAWLERKDGPRRLLLVAEEEAVLVGYAVVLVVAPEAELELIAVAREAQRRGVGRLLLEGASADAYAAGASRLLLEIRVSNAPAAALYRRAGFVETGRRRGYYEDPKEDAILMERKLL